MNAGQQKGNLSASVRQQLLDLSRERGEEYNLVLTLYAVERLLYRLSRSAYAGRFVLKGALLLALWTDRLYRPTRDLDLLGHGDSSQGALASLFRELCMLEVQADGLAFQPDSVQVVEIRGGQEYGGQRVQLAAMLGKARILLQVDVGFGDVVTPAVAVVEYPALLEFPAPRLRAYTPESVIAEKLQAMVSLGMINSRLKDFYDVWTMSRELAFDGRTLARAIRRTFERRGTPVPVAAPVALTPEFASALDKSRQWSAFLARSRLDVGRADLPQVIDDLHQFVMPPLSAAAGGLELQQTWHAGGPWTD